VGRGNPAAIAASVVDKPLDAPPAMARNKAAARERT